MRGTRGRRGRAWAGVWLAAAGDLRAAVRHPAAVVLGVVLLGAAGGCGEAAAPARQVVVYCSVDEQVAQPILEAFQRESGIRVLARYDTEAGKTVGLVQRLRAKAARPEADVFWSGEVFHTIRLAEEGLLEAFRPEGLAPRPEGLADAGGRWHGFALRVRVAAYHTGRVAEAEAPGRLEDLLDPKWRGRVVMAVPEFGTTCGHVASWFAHYGAERATEILRGLRANGVRLVDGNTLVVRHIATGQADVGLTDTDDVYAAQRNGWPVAMKYLGHGDGGALAIPNTVALVAGGPHPAEGRALVTFLLGERAERMLAESDSHNTPTHPAVAGDYPAYACPRLLAVDYARVSACMPEAMAAAGKILR